MSTPTHAERAAEEIRKLIYTPISAKGSPVVAEMEHRFAAIITRACQASVWEAESADKRRLDWLADPSSPLPRICLFPSHGYYVRVNENKPSVCEELRASIDRAITEVAELDSTRNTQQDTK